MLKSFRIKVLWLASAGLTAGLAGVATPPNLVKSFADASIPLTAGATPVASTTIELSVSNPNSTPLTNITFTDDFTSPPTGLKVFATPDGGTSSCLATGGGVTAGTLTPVPSQGSTSVTITGLALAGGASCNLLVAVYGTVPGHQTNNVPTVSTVETGSGWGLNSTTFASIDVVAPPSMTKSFDTLQTPQSAAITGITLGNPTTISFAALPPSAQVGSVFTITGSTCADLNNAFKITGVAGNTVMFAFDSTACPAGPSGTAVFPFISTELPQTPSSSITGITTGATTTLTLAAAPPANAIVGAPFVVAGVSGTVNCGGMNGEQTITNVDTGSKTVSFNYNSSSCTSPVSSGGSFGQAVFPLTTLFPFSSITSVGATTTLNLSSAPNPADVQTGSPFTVTGASNAGACAGLNGAHTITSAAGSTISFTLNTVGCTTSGVAVIPVASSVATLTYTIHAPSSNSVGLTGVSFSDPLPAGILLAAPNGLTDPNACGGVVFFPSGSSSIVLSSGNLAPGASCSFSVNILGFKRGLWLNSSTVTSTNGRDGNTATANIAVIAPPALTKSFSPNGIPPGGTSTLTFTISNPNANIGSISTNLTGIGFSDLIPGATSPGLAIVAGQSNSSVCNGGALSFNPDSVNPTSISVSGGTLNPLATCTFSVNVTTVAANVAACTANPSLCGLMTNTTSVVTSDEAGNGDPASADLSVLLPPSVTKSYVPNQISLGGMSTVTITISNPNTGISPSLSLTNVSFFDSFLGSGVTTVGSALTNSCGAAVATNSITLTGLTLAPGGSCVVSVGVTGSIAGAHLNTVNVTSSGGTGTASDTLTVIVPPAITKSFTPSSIAAGGASTLSFVVTNPNAVPLTGVGFTATDTFPAGIQLSSLTPVMNTCGVTPAVTTSSVTLSGVTLPVTGCTLSFTVTGTLTGTNCVTPTSSNGGTGAQSCATLTVILPPAITKSFTPSSIAAGGTSTLSFVVTNPNPVALTGVGFTATDTFPAGIQLASLTPVMNTCGITPAVTTSSVTLSGVTLPVTGCTLSFTVTGTSTGTNCVTPTSSNGGTGAQSCATLTVILPPVITKSFSPTPIAAGGTSTLSFVVTNPNPVALTGVGFTATDTFPAGIQLASLTPVMNTCGVTPAVTTSSVTLSGVTLPVTGCTLSFTVTGTSTGINCVTPTSSNGGTGLQSCATLTVIQPPAITKSFTPSSIAAGGTSTLSFVVTNPNPVALTGVGFTVTDTFPAGIQLASLTPVMNTCGITPAVTTSSVTLSGVTLPVTGCTLSFTVTGTSTGTNCVTPTSSNGGTGAQSCATLTVIQPPAITKSFTPSSIAAGGTSTLSFVVTNPNPVALTGVGFTVTDTFPAGIQLASLTPVMNTCGITPAVTTSSVMLSGVTLPVTGCTLSFTVTGTLTGNNCVTPTSSNGGTGAQSCATLTVILPPVITKSFNPTPIAAGGTSTLSFVVTNPNAVPLTGVGFTATDTFPAGIQLASLTPVMNTCGVTPAVTTSSVMLSGVTLPVTGCTLSFTVTGTLTGNNCVTPTSSNGGTGAQSCATLTVILPPVITKSFNPTPIAAGGTSTLSFVVTNPNPVALTGVGFTATDTFPAGIQLSSLTPVTNTCGVTPAVTTSSVTLSGVTLPVIGCTLSFTVTGTLTGNNCVTPTSSNGGTGAQSCATLTVILPPVITKSFTPSSIAAGGTSTLSFIVTNPNAVALTGVGFTATDTFPAGIQLASLTPVTNTCGVTPVVTTSSVMLSGVTLPVTGCTLSFTVTGTLTGNNCVTPTSSNGGTGAQSCATLTVLLPPAITKSFTPSSIAAGGTSTLSFVVTNPNAVALTGVGFTATDTFPAGIQLASLTPVTNTCGVTPVVTTSSVMLSGVTLPVTGCTLSFTVTGTLTGNNCVTPTSSNGGTGTQSCATLTVILPPAITKSFNPTPIAAGGTSTLSFVVTNPNAIALTGVAFTATDTFPAGIQLANLTPVTNTCGVAPVVTTSSVMLSGVTLPVTGCTLSFTVTGTLTGNNCVTPTSTNGGTGIQACGTLTVILPPTITKSFNPSPIVAGGTSTLTFALMNPNTVPLTGVGFTVVDTFPAGIQLASLTPVTNTCGIAPVVTTSSVMLSGVTLPVTGCTLSFTVTGTATGNNCVTPTSSNGGTGLQACGTLTVNAALPPTISKFFAPSSIAAGGTSTLSFVVSNPNAIALNGVGFTTTDNFPTGIQLANLTPVSNTCGVSPVVTTSSVMLSGVTLPAGGSCTLSFTVIGTLTATNCVTPVANISGPGQQSCATLTVTLGGITITKTFSSPSVAPLGTVTLTFTLTNQGLTPLNGVVGFTDTLPAPFTGSVPLQGTPTCLGTLSYNAGTNTISLTGGTLAPGAACQITDLVTAGATIGRVCNTSSVVSPGGSFAAIACISVGPLVEPPDSYQIDYAANLNIGDSFVNITNAGRLAGPFGANPANLGNVCANVFVFDPREELIACCTCLVTPNGLNSFSAVNDLIHNPLTPNVPTSITIDLVGSAPVAGLCNAGSASNINAQTLLSGLTAWGTTIEAQAPAGFGVVRTKFLSGNISPSELNALVTSCSFVQGDGSGFGTCGACKTGAGAQ